MVGGGAAGMMAAGQVAKAGAEILIIEKKKRPGRKLMITGKGRCNITNIEPINEFIPHFGKTGRFLRQAFQAYSNVDLMDFLGGLGLEMVTERGGRVFPLSGKAKEVVKVFMDWLDHCRVPIQDSSSVEKLLVQDGQITGVICQGKTMLCDSVILATGGASYPLTGSTGDGYALAEALGHKIIPFRPALVPLEADGAITGRMDRLTLRNINVSLYINGKKRREEFGELIFMDFGIRGATTLAMSCDVVDALAQGDQVEFSLDLKPALNEKKLEGRLLRDFEARAKEPLSSLLRGLLPREMVPVCLDLANIPHDRMAHSVSAKERRRLRNWLKDFRLEITGHRPFSEAIVTAGGISTKEVNPKTMESRLIRGLYLVGELLDIQAQTGGYNLQAAFSMGHLAGVNAAKKNEEL